MTPAHHEALVVLRESFAALRDSIADLPPGALDWRPWPGANSLGVLVSHAVSSAEFFARVAVGHPASFDDYRRTERAAAFGVTGLTADAARATVDEGERRIAALLESGSPDDLAAVVSLPGSPADGVTGLAMLFRLVAHLREHVGHAQAIHDLRIAGAR